MPSTLSRKPPCPGKKLPVSFTFAFLLRKEKTNLQFDMLMRSSHLPKVKKNLIYLLYRQKFQKVNEQRINDPKEPEIVLLGLIFVNFGPLNKFPKI